MKLLVLLMLALPALSSGKSVLVLNPNLKDRVPKISPMRLMTRDLAPLIPLENKEKRSLSPPVKIGNTNLEWQTWTGSLPDGAVSIYNDYTKRTDYVCKFRCNAGFYTPEKGPYCYYSLKRKEHPASRFEILVNKENFEFLEWEDGSRGSVPQNSVKTCSGKITTYVGKNKYGLGKVDKEQKVFFLPWEGQEYWYNYYQVLTYDTEISSEQISDVKYKTDEAKINMYPLETMSKSTITNNECHPVSKTVTLTTTSQVEQSWNINFSIGLGIKRSITAQIPFIGTSIELSLQTTFQFSKGTTRTESNTHSVNVQLSVPPNHSCSVRIVGHKCEANIPFTARISRTYRNGETKWASISGTYNGIQIGDVQGVVDRCKPTPNAKSCPLK
ncbi:natterin-3-like [Anabas testudineus]|uniref:natterin-3-like n=1 Tax=Anabas testudineus TaxID=64144 RepID=UPI000E459A40|nr:natterin-3-like [Anabas testudineus]